MKATAPSEALDMWNDVSRFLPDEVDPVAERARHQRRRRQEHQGGVARALQDADQWRRLALARSGHDRQVSHDVGVLDLGDRLTQEILRDGEVEQRIVGHRLGTLSLTPASGKVPPPCTQPYLTVTSSSTNACSARMSSWVGTVPITEKTYSWLPLRQSTSSPGGRLSETASTPG